jgi:undecaprenyl-diphosphatase
MSDVKKSLLYPLFQLLAWLGGHEVAVLLALGGIASGVWAFGALAARVMEGDTRAFDRMVLLALRRPGDFVPIGAPVLPEIARDLTALGGIAVIALLTAIVVGFLVLDGKKRMALFVCAALAGGFIVSTILKSVFLRPRPDLVPHIDYVSTSSFPSGHSMMSAIAYLTLGALLARSQEGKRLKAYFILVAALLAFVIGLSRVYLGVHWPTDVLAGWIAGVVWALLCWVAARWLQRRAELEPAAEHAPEM